MQSTRGFNKSSQLKTENLYIGGRIYFVYFKLFRTIYDTVSRYAICAVCCNCCCMYVASRSPSPTIAALSSEMLMPPPRPPRQCCACMYATGGEDDGALFVRLGLRTACSGSYGKRPGGGVGEGMEEMLSIASATGGGGCLRHVQLKYIKDLQKANMLIL